MRPAHNINLHHRSRDSKRDLIKYLYSNSSNGYSDAALIEFGSVNKRKPEGIFNV